MLQVLFCEISPTDEAILKKVVGSQLGKLQCDYMYYKLADFQGLMDFLQTEIDARRIIFIRIHNDKIADMEKLSRTYGGENKIIGLGEDYQAGRLAFDLQLDFALQMPLVGTPSEHFNQILEQVAQSEKVLWFYQSRSQPLSIVLDQVEYFEVYARKVLMHVENEEILVDMRLNDLERVLNSSGFFRVHSNYLVNIFAIAEVIGNTIFTKSGYVVLMDPENKIRFRHFYASHGHE